MKNINLFFLYGIMTFAPLIFVYIYPGGLIAIKLITFCIQLIGLLLFIKKGCDIFFKGK